MNQKINRKVFGQSRRKSIRMQAVIPDAEFKRLKRLVDEANEKGEWGSRYTRERLAGQLMQLGMDQWEKEND